MSETSTEIESNDVLEYLEKSIDSLYLDLKDHCKGVTSGEDVIKSIDEYLFQKICNELEYCKNKTRFSYLDTKSLANILLTNLNDIPRFDTAPRPLFVAILIKIGLDRFCKC